MILFKSENYSNKLFSSKVSLEKLINIFENEYPAYYKLKYDQQLATVHDIRNNILKPKTALIEYFIGDKRYLCFQHR